MHHATSFRTDDLVVRERYAGHSQGYRHVSHINRAIGAIHTDLGTSELASGGTVDPHVHSYEEFIYVLGGTAVLTVDGEARTIGRDEGAFVAVGSSHSWHNPGDEPCRWIELVTPQARPLSMPSDTFFVGGQAPTAGEPLNVRDPRTRNMTKWGSGQMDLDVVRRTAPVDAPDISASMASALMAYSGIAVKMLLDERHGACLGNMFMVDYEPVVVLHPHDHTVEEAFYMLEGEVEFFADDQQYTLREGDVAYAGVGCIHAFENRSGARCRWLETRAPLPPLRHPYRYERDWAYLRERESA
jgi:quercetin dioxygenase-like cupin family protein